MLACLGIPYVRADGEAEAYAAKLNSEGLVDAVVTDDSDAFCYGATTVLRNFSISGIGSTAAEIHTIHKLETHLNLDRRRLIFMAILLGCDFCPQGVPGVGKETVRSLLSIWPISWDPIKIVRMWKETGFSSSLPPESKKGQKSGNFRYCFSNSFLS